ncbi:MAG: DUF4416 family protein [Candidatus Binatia bacterium]
MGSPREPSPVKLFVALLSNDKTLIAPVEAVLSDLFGAIDWGSDLLPWHVTNYYREEMGSRLQRKFISFTPLIEPSKLADIKLITHDVEARYLWSSGAKRGRNVNVDPGYLETSKVVLASTKNAAHRLYLKAGIYGEVTLRFHQGAFEPFTYTYPDYRWPQTLSFFLALRSAYLRQLRAGRQNAG